LFANIDINTIVIVVNIVFATIHFTKP